MYARNGIEFDIHAFQLIEETQYPVGWFFDAERRAALDVVDVADTQPPAVTATQIAQRDGAEQNDAGAWVSRWRIVDLTVDEIAERDASKAAAFATARAALVVRIDADVDAIYAAVIGNRSDEYNAANVEATAYKAADYAGPVPASVQSWATAKAWTASQAAVDILAAAAHLTALRDTIRAQRLAKKEAARTAANMAALDTVAALWAAALASIRTAAGL